MWASGAQDVIYSKYDTVYTNQNGDHTIGWMYTWDVGHNRWSFNDEFAGILGYDNHFLPMYAYPLCSEATDTAMGDGSCDDTICTTNGDPQCTHEKGRTRQNTIQANGYGSKWFAYFNEPYGSDQADVTPAGAFLKWNDFMSKVDTYAADNNFARSEIKILGPSVGSKEAAMLWAEEWYFEAIDNPNYQVDAINIHEYGLENGGNTVGQHCECNPLLVRDKMSHIRQKFGLPIWLTEFNCGNGYWQCPRQQHEDYIKAMVPILEEHPWVVRYNWFAALASQTVDAGLNYWDDAATPYELTPDMGVYYNTYRWDGTPSQNPQWGYNQETWTSTTPPPTTTPAPTADAVWTYEFPTNRGNHQTALDTCAGLGMTLARPGCEYENNLLQTAIHTYRPGEDIAAFLNVKYESGAWTLANDYENFDGGAPNSGNSASIRSSDSKWINKWAGEWGDIICVTRTGDCCATDCSTPG